MLGYNHSSTKVFLQVLSDEGFKSGTPVATQVLESADLLFKWCSRLEYKETVSTFATSLAIINDLSSALEQDNCKSMTTRRERMKRESQRKEMSNHCLFMRGHFNNKVFILFKNFLIGGSHC